MRNDFRLGIDTRRSARTGKRGIGLVAVLAWSAVVWVVYLVLRATSNLVAGNLGWIADTITGLAGSIGLGGFAKTLNPEWWLTTLLWLLDSLLLPATILVWVLGGVLAFLAPDLIARLRRSRRYRD